MIHIHARRPDGTPSYEVEDFAAIVGAIRAELGDDDVIVNLSTGAVGVPVAKRIAYLRALRPDVAALNMGSMNYAKYSATRKAFVFSAVFANPFEEIVELLEAMNELAIRPEHECFDVGHVGSLAPLLDMGVLARAAARRLRHGRHRRDPADGAQPRRDGRQHPGRRALGRRRRLARAVDARGGGARARRIDPRRPGGQPLPARRDDGALQRRARRAGAADDASTRAAGRRRSPRRARCSGRRGDERCRPGRWPASASWTSAACCPAASARCCSPTTAPTCSRSRTWGWATTSAGRRRTSTAPRRAPARRCFSR